MQKSQPLLRRPWVRAMLWIIVAFICYLLIPSRPGSPFVYKLISFIFWLGLVTGVFLTFFSQFVLPLRALDDRRQIIRRLFMYMLGQGGPAIFIENGRSISRGGELEKKKAGVIILDTASGAVLRNDVKFKRVVGPGLVFTTDNEYLADSVDLHRKTSPLAAEPLGPKTGEKPFDPWDKKSEIEDEYKQRQKRRLETSGLTRDGVEVIPNIRVPYRLERLPGAEDISFGFNPNAVEAWVRANGIARQAREAGADEARRKELFGMPGGEDWLYNLPAYLAVDVWREYLQKFPFSELFVSPLAGPRQDETGLETILRMVRLRLTSIQVEILDNVGQPTGGFMPSREFEILQDAGIRVDGVSISQLRFTPEVESKLVRDWVATWLERAQAERDRIDLRRSTEAEAGKQRGRERFAAASIRRFDRELLSLPRPKQPGEEFFQMKMTLDRLLRGTLQGCLVEPQLQQRLGNELNSLSEIINWVRVQEP